MTRSRVPRSTLLIVFAALMHFASVASAIFPVEASVRSVWLPGEAQLRVLEPGCVTYQAPEITRDGANITVRQTYVEADVCTATPPGPSTRTYGLGALPAGIYQLTYRQFSVAGVETRAPENVRFVVRARTSRQIGFTPADPVALEPITLSFERIISCEKVLGVVPVNGGFRVELEFRDGFCDDPGQDEFVLGAFAPGTYRVELARPAGQGGGIVDAATITVGPASVQRDTERSRNDWSGLWFSATDAPSTGMQVVHTRVSPTSLATSLTAFLYTYDSSGAPAWYVIVAQETGVSRVFRGDVLRFARGSAPATGVANQMVGNAVITFGTLEDNARLAGSIQGAGFEARMERLRWVRPAWPGQ